MAGLLSPIFLLTGLLSVYALTFQMLCRAVLINLIILQKNRNKWGSFQGCLFNAFVHSDSEAINKRFKAAFFITALISFLTLSGYLSLFAYWTIVEPRSDRFEHTLEYCSSVKIYEKPIVILTASSLCLLLSNSFLFFVILSDWQNIQNNAYRIRRFFCGRCFAIRGYEADISTDRVGVPGEKTDIELVLKRSESISDGNPKLRKTMKRDVSFWDDVGIDTRVPPHLRAHPVASKETDHEVETSSQKAPNSPKVGNYGDASSRAELISFKPRTTSLLQHENTMTTIGEATEV